MDWEGDLYDQWIFPEVMCYIREDMIFDNPEQLVKQMNVDREFFQRWLDQQPDV